ncbi:MAG: hypothetical protein C0616_09160 [Desulfuromonas sp.]|nr:MAG: hypothetical protein C0616_09160 [Desulfuromonas sp.]
MVTVCGIIKIKVDFPIVLPPKTPAVSRAPSVKPRLGVLMGNIVTTIFPVGKGSQCITTIDQIGRTMKAVCTCSDFLTSGDCYHVEKMKKDAVSLIGSSRRNLRELNG